MSYSIEDLKSVITAGRGIAKANLYRVILPIIPEIYINAGGIGVPNPLSLNILCKNAQIPGRQLLTNDRVIGTVAQKVAYGFANEDVTLTFMGLNNYVARKYFENWQHFAINENSYEVKYKNEYAKTVTIQQLDMSGRVVYGVNLEKAFPTQILNIDFANDNNTPVEVSVTLSYTRWVRTSLSTDIITSLL